MPFKPGPDPNRAKGRPKGTLNKKTWEARAIAERLGFCPVETLVAWAQGDWQKLGYDSRTKTVVTKDGERVEVDRIDEQLRQKSAKDLVPFLLPQLKAIEVSGEGGDVLNTFAQMVAALVKESDADTSQPQGQAPAEEEMDDSPEREV